MEKIISDKVEENEECTHIFILYCDGELIMTKGGPCFLQRKFFQRTPPMITSKVPMKLSKIFDKEWSGFACSYFQDDTDPRIREYKELLSNYIKEDLC